MNSNPHSACTATDRPLGRLIVPILLFAPLLLGSSPVRVQSKKEALPRRTAAGVVMIHRSFSSSSLGQEMVRALLTSSEVAAGAAEQVLGIEGELWQERISLQSRFTNAHSALQVHLSVSIYAEEGQSSTLATDYLAAVIERFRRVVHEVNQLDIARLEEDLATARSEQPRIEEQLVEIRKTISDLTAEAGLPGANANQVRNAYGALEAEITMLRRKIRNSQENLVWATRNRENQEVAEQWRRVVAFWEARLVELQKLVEEGEADASEVAECEARLAEARAHVPGVNIGRKTRFAGAVASEELTASAIDGMERLKADLEFALERKAQVEQLDLRRIAAELQALENEEPLLLQQLAALKTGMLKRERQLREAQDLSIIVVGD